MNRWRTPDERNVSPCSSEMCRGNRRDPWQ
jgi:hypothetical protein